MRQRCAACSGPPTAPRRVCPAACATCVCTRRARAAMLSWCHLAVRLARERTSPSRVAQSPGLHIPLPDHQLSHRQGPPDPPHTHPSPGACCPRRTSWSSSLKSDSWMTADREAPMPPVFMHSSTMMACRGGRTGRQHVMQPCCGPTPRADPRDRRLQLPANCWQQGLAAQRCLCRLTAAQLRATERTEGGAGGGAGGAHLAGLLDGLGDGLHVKGLEGDEVNHLRRGGRRRRQG